MSNLPPKTPRKSGGRTSQSAATDTAVTELLSPLSDPKAQGMPDAAGAHAVDADQTVTIPPAQPVPTLAARSAAPAAPTEPALAPAAAQAPVAAPTSAATPRSRPFASALAEAPERTALVVLVGLVALAVAFIVVVFVGVSSASINALAVIVAPIASMVAAYYGITLSIQQVTNERAEKQRALERADAATTAGRETEIWAGQMEAGLRVAMAKLNAAGINTDEVTKAAGTPADFF